MKTLYKLQIVVWNKLNLLGCCCVVLLVNCSLVNSTRWRPQTIFSLIWSSNRNVETTGKCLKSSRCLTSIASYIMLIGTKASNNHPSLYHYIVGSRLFNSCTDGIKYPQNGHQFNAGNAA